MDRRNTVIRICTTLILLSVATFAAEENATRAISVDQAGYLPDAPKIAIVRSAAKTFVVRRATDKKSVFVGKLSAARKDDETGDTVQWADFSSLRSTGKYYLYVPGVGRSWPFSIGEDVFSHPLYLALHAFYGQRCGIAVDLGREFPGYKYAACHLIGGLHSSSGRTGAHQSSGGWHDAGDYGRYITSSSVTVATLMWSWEMYGSKLNDLVLNIPESGNGTPDILNETRWNLDWMFSMQDADGGVWHKQTSEKFAGFVMPDKDVSVSQVIGTGIEPFKSTCATADLAAVGALAARVYKPYDPDFAAHSLDAARKAWNWSEEHPDVVFTNPTGVETGEYGDAQCGDERFWAAAELYRTTGESRYGSFVKRNYSRYLDYLESPPAENWSQMAPFAVWTYLLAERGDKDSAAADAMRKRVLEAARQIAERTRQNGYKVSTTAKDYVWGSNGNVAQYGMQLLVANKISPDSMFVEAAADNLHYLLGRNCLSLSFVTQVGANPVRHPHHRPSIADDNPEPWPGLLAGGPNAARQDEVLRKLPDLPPAKAYVDDERSYAGNEVAINWQAMLVFLLSGIKR